MKFLPKFIRQLAFSAIEAEIAHVWPTTPEDLTSLQAKLISAIRHALAL